MRELFASGHVIEHLHYAFPIYAPQVHVDVAYREASICSCLIRNTRVGTCDALHIAYRRFTIPRCWALLLEYWSDSAGASRDRLYIDRNIGSRHSIHA